MLFTRWICLCFWFFLLNLWWYCVIKGRGGLGSQTGRGKNIKAALLTMAAKRVERETGEVQGPAPGGHWPRKGYGDVWPWRPSFHAPPAVCKGPILSKIVSSQDPLLRKFGNFSLNSLNFRPNFSSQAPKFGNFQLASPQIWKFSVHKPPNLEIFSSQAPLFRGK